MPSQLILDLVADIAVAHLQNNPVAADDVPNLLETIYSALTGLGRTRITEHSLQASVRPRHRRPKNISIKSSVKPESITCLECGKAYKMLMKHLPRHDLTPMTYMAKWQLPSTYPMIAPEYAEKRRKMANDWGLEKKRPKSEGNVRRGVMEAQLSKQRKKLSPAYGQVRAE